MCWQHFAKFSCGCRGESVVEFCVCEDRYDHIRSGYFCFLFAGHAIPEAVKSQNR